MYGTGGVPRTPAATTRSCGLRPAALTSTSTSSAAGTGRLTVLTTGTPPTSSTTAARMAGDPDAGVGMATSNLRRSGRLGGEERHGNLRGRRAHAGRHGERADRSEPPHRGRLVHRDPERDERRP